MKVRFDSPVVLTYVFLVFFIYIFSHQLVPSGVSSIIPFAGIFQINNFIIHSNFNFFNFTRYYTLITHIFGHADWAHIWGNMSFIILLGPNIEERFGSWKLLFMIFITALVTGLINAAIMPYNLLGASGIVFMMIILTSMVRYSGGSIPLSFIAVFVIFIGQEVYKGIFVDDNVSQFTHIVGGITGAILGHRIMKSRSSAGPSKGSALGGSTPKKKKGSLI